MSTNIVIHSKLNTLSHLRFPGNVELLSQVHCHYRPSPRRPMSVVVACTGQAPAQVYKTCRNCKKQFNPVENHSRACRYHTAHFGGETKRKFESVYKGGTMNTAGGGEILTYWHCCGCEDPFDLGCMAAPHASYDD